MTALRSLLAAIALLFCATQAQAAARFWVGGTGTWDNSATTHWSATSGGAAGQSAPVSTDDVTFDGSSGGGTVTVNATLAVNSLTEGAHTGTLDFSANNNNITFSANGAGVNISGTGTRTLNLGNGTWTLNTSGGNGPGWDATTTTNLTFNKNGSTLVFATASGDQRFFTTGGLSYNIVSFATAAALPITIIGSPTIATFNVTAPVYLRFNVGVTVTVTNAFNWTGTSSNQNVFLVNNNSGGTVTITTGAATTNTAAWSFFQGITFTPNTGSTLAASNSFDGKNNSGFTITAPSGGGGGGGHIIGGGL